MNLTTHIIPIASTRNGSGWKITIIQKRKYLYITTSEYLLPHDLETNLDYLLNQHYIDIKKKFGIKISVHTWEQKIESEECLTDFIDYIKKMINDNLSQANSSIKNNHKNSVVL